MKKQYRTKKCDLCGKEFTPSSPPQKYCSTECYEVMQHKFNMERKKEVRRMVKLKVIEPVKEFVNKVCPKDCRFRDKLDGGTYYCNYGEIACAEGLTDKPARNLDPDSGTYNCGGKLYEPRTDKSKRKKSIALISKPKTDEEVNGYQREIRDKIVGNEYRRGNMKNEKL